MPRCGCAACDAARRERVFHVKHALAGAARHAAAIVVAVALLAAAVAVVAGWATVVGAR